MPRRRPRRRLLEPDTAIYYLRGIDVSTWVCENCGQYIIHPDAWHQIAAQCHILPKEHYDSVKSLPENRLHLCPTCHNNFDSSWQKAASMPVFTLACERLALFIHKVKEALPPVFLRLLE